MDRRYCRQHPRWQVIGFPPDSRAFHDAFWPKLRAADFAHRRAYDWRAALLLIQQGVTEFATVNEKDFRLLLAEPPKMNLHLDSLTPRVTIELT